jgi:hypothetical protein
MWTGEQRDDHLSSVAPQGAASPSSRRCGPVSALVAPARAATLVLVGAVAATACSGGGVADHATTAAPATTAASTPAASTTAASTTVVAGGFTFTDSAGGYSVLFPAEPEDQQQTLKLPDGSSVPYAIHVWTDPASGVDRGLASAVIVYPPGTQVSLDGARDSVVASFPDASLTDSEDITLQDRKGLAFTVDLTGGGSYISQIYAGDARLYQLVYVGRDISSDDADAKAFFDSFEFS